jgi:hypothetical protein
MSPSKRMGSLRFAAGELSFTKGDGSLFVRTVML